MEKLPPAYPPPAYAAAISDVHGAGPSESASIYCWRCGAKCFTAQANFCSSCGVMLVQTCQPSLASAPLEPPPVLQQPQQQQQQQELQQELRANNSSQERTDMAVLIKDQLIYDFEKIACCMGQVVGLHPGVKDDCPQELLQKGITPEQWRSWMEELMSIQKKATSVCGCLLMFCFPGFIVQSILCAALCPISMNHCLTWLPCCYGDWYEALRNWQDKVNSTLGPKNMHAKLLTYKPFQRAPKSKLYSSRIAGKDDKYEMSFLVISLNEASSKRLRNQSWDNGVNDGCTSGIGRCL